MKNETRMISSFLSWVAGLNGNDIFENHKQREESLSVNVAIIAWEHSEFQEDATQISRAFQRNDTK